jgi:hypothetical protein
VDLLVTAKLKPVPHLIDADIRLSSVVLPFGILLIIINTANGYLHLA